MPDPSKTEPATPKRRREARERGQIARSQEIGNFLILLAFLVAIRFWASHMLYTFQAIYKQYLGHLNLYNWNQEMVKHNAIFFFVELLYLLMPIFVASAIGGLAAGMGQAGLFMSAKPITPTFSKMNPVNGFQRIVSKQGLVELLRSTLKIGLVGWVAYATVSKHFGQFLMLSDIGVMQGIIFFAGVVYQLIFRTLIVIAIIAVLDFFFQRRMFEDNLKMTKEEVKEEMKQVEGDPKIRGRRKSKQRQLAMQRMMQAVPKAVVVVTNPTHLAVALEYDEALAAPKVVAKGAGFIAEKIKEIARENKIAIMEKPPLARSLFKNVEIGRFIPPELYRAVAEIIAYVYQLKTPVKGLTKEG